METEIQKLKRARRLAIILGGYTICVLIAIVYGLTERSERIKNEQIFAQQSLENKHQMEVVLQELENCRQK